MRLTFMGTSELAVAALAALVEAGHDIVGVYTQPPRPAGRGHRETRSPVHRFADARGFAVRTPRTLKDEDVQHVFAALAADVAVVASYGLILPKPVLDAPRLGCLNVHASLLPRWRGAAPVQHAILAGDVETGVTIMQMDEGLDTGPILLRRAVPIAADTNSDALHETLGVLGGALIVEALEKLSAGRLAPTPQPEDGATYAKKLSRADGELDWTKDARALERQVRAFDPWPGSWFRHAGERIRVLAAHAEAGGGAPGTLVDDRLGVACGTGVLRLLRVQREGRAALDAEAFLRGYRLPAGTRLTAPE